MNISGPLFRKFLELSGMKYRFYDYRYRREYDSYPVEPIQVSPQSIKSVTGSINPRNRGHIDYDPHFMPKTSSWSLATPTKTVDWRSEIAGDWDCDPDQFNDLVIFRSIRNHFKEGLPWSDTKYYSKHKERIESGNTTYCESVSTLQEKCSRIDHLYESIKSNGYQSQKSLNGRPDHEIAVNIGRNGEILYNSEGRHRLSIAKLLNIDYVPVIVLAKHPDSPNISDLDIDIR